MRKHRAHSLVWRGIMHLALMAGMPLRAEVEKSPWVVFLR